MAIDHETVNNWVSSVNTRGHDYDYSGHVWQVLFKSAKTDPYVLAAIIVPQAERHPDPTRAGIGSTQVMRALSILGLSQATVRKVQKLNPNNIAEIFDAAGLHKAVAKATQQAIASGKNTVLNALTDPRIGAVRRYAVASEVNATERAYDRMQAASKEARDLAGTIYAKTAKAARQREEADMYGKAAMALRAATFWVETDKDTDFRYGYIPEYLEAHPVRAQDDIANAIVFVKAHAALFKAPA